MKYKDLLSKSTEYLIQNNNEESIALYLLEYISGKTSPELFASLDNECKAEEEKKMEAALKEVVINNRPVQYVIGQAPFYGYNFKVNENVLIPRFETEELVENVLLKYDELFKGKKVDVCDLATGSGCIGITLKLEEPNFNMTITDISSEALEVARYNAKTLGAEVRILQGDMLEPLKGMKFDILVSNPPYIPTTENVMSLVKDNEPNIALFGGSDGMKFYRIILSGAKELLNDKALIAFEHGYDKKEEMLKLAREYFPNAKVEVLKDMQGKDRMTLIEIGF